MFSRPPEFVNHHDRTRCRWCGCPKAGDPSDYYHEKSCHRTDALRRLKAAEAAGDTDAINRLRREVEAASYVGD